MTKKIKKVTTITTEEIIDIPTNEKTQIICILDRSGSMASIIGDSIGGFNTFLEEQQKLKDEASLTVVLFDDQYELLYDDVDIKKVQKITDKEWKPRGTTALHDAIGKTINTVRAQHAKLGTERPSKVLVCVVTDGAENASVEYKWDQIVSLIKDCEKDNWNFIYLGANVDAMKVSGSYGMSVKNSYTYTATSHGVYNMSATLNNAVTNYRSMSVSSPSFSVDSKSLINDPNIDGNNNTTNAHNGNNSSGVANSNTITLTTTDDKNNGSK